MSSKTKPDGGPAFPRKRSVHRKEVISLCGAPNSEYVHDLPQDGMTLRDWFATNERLSEWDMPDAIMSKQTGELLAGEPMPSGGYSSQPIEMLRWEAKWRAALKYIRADAMLAERNK